MNGELYGQLLGLWVKVRHACLWALWKVLFSRPNNALAFVGQAWNSSQGEETGIWFASSHYWNLGGPKCHVFCIARGC